MEKLFAERNGTFIEQLIISRFSQTGFMGFYLNPLIGLHISAGEMNFNHHVFQENTGVYCFFVSHNGKNLPFYIGITHQTFKRRFQQHADGGVLSSFWNAHPGVPVGVDLIFVKETAISKLIESVFLGTFDFAYNSAENGKVRGMMLTEAEDNLTSTFVLFKKSWNDGVHTLSCVYDAYKSIVPSISLPVNVTNAAEWNREFFFSTFVDILPKMLYYKDGVIMRDKIIHGFKLDKVQMDTGSYKFTLPHSTNSYLLDRSGLYCFYVVDAQKYSYPMYIGYTSQSYKARFGQHNTNPSGALLKLSRYWEGCGFNHECDVFVVLVSIMSPVVCKFMESVYLKAFDFILNTQENSGLQTPSLPDRIGYIHRREKAYSVDIGQALFTNSCEQLLGLVHVLYERKLFVMK